MLKTALFLLIFVSFFHLPSYSQTSPAIGYLTEGELSSLKINDQTIFETSVPIENSSSERQMRDFSSCLNQLYFENKLDPNQIESVFDGQNGLIVADKSCTFTISPTIAEEYDTNPVALTLEWTNRLRLTLGASHIIGIRNHSLQLEKGNIGEASW